VLPLKRKQEEISMTIDELMDDDSNVRSSEKNISAKTELSGTNKR
jgi:hypothetical protein